MLAKRLRELRIEKSLSQSDIAKIVGVSQQAIGNYESGTRTPDPDTIIKLANFFSVTTDYLLGLADISKHQIDEISNVEIEELLKKSNVQFDGVPLDEEDKEDLLEFIKVAWKQINKRK